MGEIPEHFQNTSSGDKEAFLSLESPVSTIIYENGTITSSEPAVQANGLPSIESNRMDLSEKQLISIADLETGCNINSNQEDRYLTATNLEEKNIPASSTNLEDGNMTTTNIEDCSTATTNLQKHSETNVDETPSTPISEVRSLAATEEEFITTTENRRPLTTTCEDIASTAGIERSPHSSSVNGLDHNNSISSETLSTNGLGQDGDEQDAILLLERRSFKPFKSSEDYLYAMREDLAEWLNGLYGLNITVHDFFETLENGVLLCQHTNNVRRAAEEFYAKNHGTGKKFSSRYHIPHYEVHYRRDSAPGSFFARDNVHNFIKWCRDLGVHDVLMFETDDLVLRKNEKHVILALLEIARRGARFGMPAPLLVQMEADIDREIEKDRLAQEGSQGGSVHMGQEGSDQMGWSQDGGREQNDEPPNLIYGPQPQVVTNDLMSLDEMVRDLVERCKCPSQFPMIKVSEGKYRIGDTKVLIFVRILRNHVMVRVGGGWDTLHHYLDKHDPCRCKSGHRVTISSKVGFKTPSNGDRHLSSVTYERTEEGYPSSPGPRRKSNGLRRDSGETKGSLRHRSHSPALKENGPGVYSPRLGGRKEEQPGGASNCGDMWCDSSSEVSDEGYKSQGPPRPAFRTRRMSPKKLGSDFTERPNSSMTQVSSEGSSASTDDIGTPSSPAYCTNASSNTLNVPSPKPGSHIPRSLPSKNKSSFVDSLLIKKPKSKSVVGDGGGRRAWNAGPGVRGGNGEPRSRRSSISDTVDGRKISRSRSATSEGGFQSMLRKDSGTRQSPRGVLPRSSIDGLSGKNTWNGRSRQKDYPNLAADAFRPPLAARSIRSASASPATTRKVFTSSAPSTPVNRSPKRFNHSPNPSNSTPAFKILSQFPDLSGDGDEEILVELESFVNNYRAYVLDKLAAEGRSLPPELAAEEWEKESSRPKLKANPRKAGLGSRIPAPVF